MGGGAVGDGEAFSGAFFRGAVSTATGALTGFGTGAVFLSTTGFSIAAAGLGAIFLATVLTAGFAVGFGVGAGTLFTMDLTAGLTAFAGLGDALVLAGLLVCFAGMDVIFAARSKDLQNKSSK